VRRALADLLVVVASTGVGPSHPPREGASTVRACTWSQVSVTQYNVSVAAGTVGELNWAADTSARACTLSGYVRVAFSGNYGSARSRKPPQPLAVTEAHARRYVNVAGVARNRRLPTVTVSPAGAIASFWIFGTDEPHVLNNGQTARCIVSDDMSVWLPGATQALTVQPMRAADFYWCGPVSVYPVVAGDTGSDPPTSLTSMFGTPA